MSPGCLADGAKDNLLKLQALAPSSASTGSIVQVCEGGCQSLCGSGPIVVIDGTKKMTKVKRNEKLLPVLQDSTSSKEQDEDTSKSPVWTADQRKLFEALDLLDAAQEQKQDKTKLNEANELYTKAIGLGIELYNIKNEDDEDQSDPRKTSMEQLAWLIEAMQSQADCLSELRLYSDSAVVMKSATQVCRSFFGSSRTSDNDNNETTVKYLYACLERCQAALEQENNKPSSKAQNTKSDELEALEELLALSPPSDLSTTQQNKRRSLGFRLQKLQRELS